MDSENFSSLLFQELFLFLKNKNFWQKKLILMKNELLVIINKAQELFYQYYSQPNFFLQ